VSETNANSSRLTKLRHRQRAKSEQRFAERFTLHWAQPKDRHPEHLPEIHAGESDFRSGRVPYGVDLAAAWAWRFLVIAAAGYLVVRTLGFLMVVVLPVVIALFITALVVPVVNLLQRMMPRGLATFLVVLGGIATVALMLTFATQQVVNGSNELANQVIDGLDKVRDWLKTGPLNVSDQQIDDAIQQMQNWVTSGSNHLVSRVTEVGTTLSHILAGFFIILFSTYFFLADGDRIWTWAVRIFPRAAREKVDSSGRVAWASLTQFVRATVLVAMTDALGISIVAAILKVPFVAAIGVLVFLGAFIPMVGASVSGAVAVLVALVAHGPIVALIMLGGVIAVQQLEAHVLQPFLMGRFVRVHPLGVIISIAIGVLVAGIAGALVAVPLAAALNAVVVHLSQGGKVEEPPEGEGDELELGDMPEETEADQPS
jgi:putative heme transporter